MNKNKMIALTALFIALTIAATMFLKIPNGLQGYIHLGDSILLLSSLYLPLPYPLISAAIASGLSDLFSGYIIYIIPSMIIKSIEVYFFKKIYFKRPRLAYSIAILIMVVGYFISECILFSFQIALLSIITNLIQGISNALITNFLIKYQAIKQLDE